MLTSILKLMRVKITLLSDFLDHIDRRYNSFFFLGNQAATEGTQQTSLFGNQYSHLFCHNNVAVCFFYAFSFYLMPDFV